MRTMILVLGKGRVQIYLATWTRCISWRGGVKFRSHFEVKGVLLEKNVKVYLSVRQREVYTRVERARAPPIKHMRIFE